jgi:hypothetical protein
VYQLIICPVPGICCVITFLGNVSTKKKADFRDKKVVETVVNEQFEEGEKIVDEEVEEVPFKFKEDETVVTIKTESKNSIYIPMRILNQVVIATDSLQSPSMNAIYRDGIWLIPDKRGFQKVYVPKTARPYAMEAVHCLESGHPGNNATIKYLRQMFIWPGLDEDVKQFIRECIVCQIVKNHPQIADMGRVLRGKQPFEIVAIDHCEMGTSVDGYKYCLVLVCCFSGHVFIQPVSDIRAVTTATVLINFAQDHVVPQVIVCDNSTSFINEVVAKFIQVMGIQLSPTMPYCQWSNLCEAAIGRVKRMFKMFMIQNRLPKSTWNLHAKTVQAILNNTPSETFGGYSPNDLVFRSSRLTPQVYVDANEKLQTLNLNDEILRFTAESRAQMTKVLQEIDDRFREETEKFKKVIIPEKSLVLVISDLYSKSTIKPPAFTYRHDKLCVVLRQNNAFSYVLKELATGLISTEHVTRLFIFKESVDDEAVPINPKIMQYANHLALYRHNIERIIDFELRNDKLYVNVINSAAVKNSVLAVNMLGSLGKLLISHLEAWLESLQSDGDFKVVKAAQSLRRKLDLIIEKQRKTFLGIAVNAKTPSDEEKKMEFSFTEEEACYE